MRTVEGLGTPLELAPIQQAWVHHYAAQCGFCTGGMMMAAQAYLEPAAADDAEAIKEALGGHVCRCTGYVKIIDAIVAVARRLVRPRAHRARRRPRSAGGGA